MEMKRPEPGTGLRQKHGTAEETGSSDFSAIFNFLPSSRSAQTSAQSKPVKPSQTSAAGKTDDRNMHKYLKMNSLNKNWESDGQTRSNRVKPVFKAPGCFRAPKRFTAFIRRWNTRHPPGLRWTFAAFKPADQSPGEGRRTRKPMTTFSSFIQHYSGLAEGAGLINCQKIKVAQAESRWLKVAQAVLKHFFYAKNQTRTDG